MPVANCTTPANGNEREQLIPLIDATNLKTYKRGRPRKRFQVIAADNGLDCQRQRQALRRRGIRPQLPKRLWKGKKNPEDRSKFLFLVFNKNVVLPGINVNIVV